jgi:rSAM/selenodomain-associated transferase 1
VTHVDNALVIFARAPRAGQVKTRLVPIFSAEEARVLHMALLGDVLERSVRALEGRATVFLAWSETLAVVSKADAFPPEVKVETQSGRDLGERMALAIQSKLRDGFKRVVILGSDSPTLPASHLTGAFDALREVEVVLGPAADGGYYLVGMSHLHLEIFRDMQWGSAGVLAATHQRLKKSGTRYTDLGMWHDVDTPEDVGRLFRDLLRMKERQAADLPVRTYRILAGLVPGRIPY